MIRIPSIQYLLIGATLIIAFALMMTGETVHAGTDNIKAKAGLWQLVKTPVAMPDVTRTPYPPIDGITGILA